MANDMYAKGRQNFLAGSIDYDADEIDTILTDAADYTRNLATHDALDDVAAAARVSISAAIAGKSNTDGTLDANDTVHSAVSGDPTEEIILYLDSGGAETADLLICNFDTSVSATPNGGDITIQWNALGIVAWS